MKNKSIFPFFILIALTLFLAYGFNSTSNPGLSQAIYWNESIENLQAHLTKQVDVLVEEHQELLALVEKNPTPDVLEQLRNHDVIIAQYKSVLDKQKHILETHNNYFEAQQSTTLDILEIRSQNQEVHENLIKVQEEVTQIKEEINAFLFMYGKLEEELDT